MVGHRPLKASILVRIQVRQLIFKRKNHVEMSTFSTETFSYDGLGFERKVGRRESSQVPSVEENIKNRGFLKRSEASSEIPSSGNDEWRRGESLG